MLINHYADCGKSIHKKCLTNSNGKENDQPGLIVDPVKKQIITIDEHWDNHNSSRDGQEERELVVVHQEKSPSVAELNDVRTSLIRTAYKSMTYI